MPTRSWWRSTSRASGSATTTCSPTCCGSSYAAVRPRRSRGLHRLAADWHAEHGDAVEAIRHAQLAGDWELAGELLGRHWVHLRARRRGGDARRAARRPAQRAPRAPTRSWRRSPPRTCSRSRAGPRPTRCSSRAQRALPELPAAPPPPRRDRARQRPAPAGPAARRARRRRRRGQRAARRRGRAGGGVELEALALMNLGIAETLDAAARGRGGAPPRPGLALARRPRAARTSSSAASATLGTVANLTRRLDLAERHCARRSRSRERLGWSTLPFVGVADAEPRRRAAPPRAARRGRGLPATAPSRSSADGARAGGDRRPAPRPRDARDRPARPRPRRLAAFRDGRAARRAAARAALPRRRPAPVAAARAAPARRPRARPRRARRARAAARSGAASPPTSTSRTATRPPRPPRSRRCSRARRSRSTPTR